jgi:dCTP diphosphatase
MAEFLEELPTLAHDIQIFSEARSWAQFHTARNIVLALLGEVGELAELVQWKGDHDNDDLNLPLTFEPKELDKLSQELADVSIYLLRLATVCDVVDPLCEALQD